MDECLVPGRINSKILPDMWTDSLLKPPGKPLRVSAGLMWTDSLIFQKALPRLSQSAYVDIWLVKNQF
ncbi:hypothetical protein PLA107_029905 (plasmid) [Pseudomonas amygdali pv. lachrymans str. M301315]|uniref:Uncharacterized protein n=1 Tax=Pseudomonas amygdali pv. lachrymans str. M301315 TaxID=629260 RepID=A0AAD0PVR3_PSEAV|nr:hypothetical protein PLA107_029905 [Pseudomonas amygdali pv. lachrymans str. M301315]